MYLGLSHGLAERYTSFVPCNVVGGQSTKLLWGQEERKAGTWGSVMAMLK